MKLVFIRKWQLFEIVQLEDLWNGDIPSFLSG